MKFKHILGECDSKEWIGPKLISPCGAAYWIVISIINLLEITGDKEFVARVSIVVPEKAPARAWQFVGDCGRFESEEYRAALIWEYGARADVWSWATEHPLEAMTAALQKAREIPEDFDDCMDSPLNRLGWTGWNFVGETF